LRRDHRGCRAGGAAAGRTDLLRGGRFFLNVGGRAVVPDIPGLSGVDYRTNSRLAVVERGSRLASREDDVILGAGEVRITKSNNGFDLTTAPVAGSHLAAVGRRPPISSTAILTRPRGA
jgi:hypothetical protein